MDPYTFGLTLGSVGLGVMALSGFAHSTHAGHGHATHGHAHSSHGHGSHGHGGPGHSGHAGHDHGGAAHVVASTGRAGSARASGASRVLSLLQPRVAFSMLVGFGAAGLLLRPVLAEPALLIAALGAGVAFEWLLVAPNGHGLVAVELDGQVVQLLATLNPAERATARKVRAGDRLRIEAVDDTRNRCTVTYLGA